MLPLEVTTTNDSNSNSKRSNTVNNNNVGNGYSNEPEHECPHTACTPPFDIRHEVLPLAAPHLHRPGEPPPAFQQMQPPQPITADLTCTMYLDDDNPSIYVDNGNSNESEYECACKSPLDADATSLCAFPNLFNIALTHFISKACAVTGREWC
jgi:hypothetical protein